MLFLISYYLDLHCPDSLLCHPKLFVSGHQICYCLPLPSTLGRLVYSQCFQKAMVRITFLSSEVLLPIQTLPAFPLTFLFLTLRHFLLSQFLWVSSILFIHLSQEQILYCTILSFELCPHFLYTFEGTSYF